MNYQITPITEHHIEGYAQALDRVARELRYLAYTAGPPLAVTVDFVRQNIAGGWPHFVALDGTEVVGWCDVATLHRPVFDHAGVLGLAVVPEHRGKGLGRRLLETTLQAAKARGLSRVELTVRERNAAAIRLYESVGFVQEGLHINSVRINGVYENHISMALFISENA